MSPLLVLIISIYLSAPVSTLRQLHIVFRHGERAPTETYKTDPYRNMTWPNGWGHLTNRGKLQMFELGMKIRKLYPDFILEYYFPEDVNILSSYADRCLMSAEVLLAGLFPPKNGQIWNEDLMWQPIPVHYVPRSEDNLIAMKSECPKYDREFNKIQNSGAIQEINKQNEKLFEFLTQQTGQDVDSIGKVEMLFNTLEIELLHNLTLPAWTRNVSLEHMKTLAARYLASFTETDFMKRMKGGVFLKRVITSMQTLDKGPVLFLYSAHDLTLVNILNTLGYKKVLKPGFGATLIFELDNNLNVAMHYRDDLENDPEKITIDGSSTCSLEQFRQSLERFLPTNWNDDCNK